jgi:hypothetical protein
MENAWIEPFKERDILVRLRSTVEGRPCGARLGRR